MNTRGVRRWIRPVGLGLIVLLSLILGIALLPHPFLLTEESLTAHGDLTPDQLQLWISGALLATGVLLLGLLLGKLRTARTGSSTSPAPQEAEDAFFELRGCVEGVLTRLAPFAHEKGLELAHYVYSDLPERLQGDAPALQRILLHLVHNAIQHTAGGHVFVRVTLEEKSADGITLRVSVSDSGAGLREAERQRLLSVLNRHEKIPRSQADSDVARLTKLLAGARGRIDIESAPGEGATFHCMLPFGAAPAPEEPPAEPGSPAGLRVLLCEPHPLARLSTLHLLTHLGLDVSIADAPARAVELLQAQAAGEHFHLVVLGLPHTASRPDRDWTWLTPIRAHFTGPLLALLNTSDDAVAGRVLACGASAWLPKPPTGDTLRRELLKLTHSGEPRPRVLLADDSAIDRKAVATLLRRAGAEVTEATDGEQALRAAAEQSFDLIVMDLGMPGMDGVEATRRIRGGEHGGARVPIVALSGNIPAERRDTLLAEGFDDLLAKPATAPELRRLLRKWIPRMKPGQASEAGDAPNHKPTDLPVYDREESIRLAGGNVRTADELLEMLLDELPERRAGLNKALSDGDLKQLGNVAHKLHGSACYCGVPALRAAVAQLERLAGTGNAEAVAAQMERVNREIERLLDQVNAAVG